LAAGVYRAPPIISGESRPQRPDQGEIGAGRHAAPEGSSPFSPGSVMMMHPVVAGAMVMHGVMTVGPVAPVTTRPLLRSIPDFRRRRTGVNAEDAFNSADHAANDAANHGANGSRLLIADVNTM
jgi:hypothetical protein